MKVKVPTNAALKDTCDYLAVELPHGWGPVLMDGHASVGGVSLSGVGSDGKALAANLTTVEVDKASVSRRSLVVKLKPVVDAKTKASTPMWL